MQPVLHWPLVPTHWSTGTGMQHAAPPELLDDELLDVDARDDEGEPDDDDADSDELEATELELDETDDEDIDDDELAAEELAGAELEEAEATDELVGDALEDGALEDVPAARDEEAPPEEVDVAATLDDVLDGADAAEDAALDVDVPPAAEEGMPDEPADDADAPPVEEDEGSTAATHAPATHRSPGQSASAVQLATQRPAAQV